MFNKNEDKNLRIPVGGDKDNTSKNVRPKIGRNMKLESEIYEQEYPDKKLMKINDVDGAVQWWIDRGAEPVPRKISNRKTFQGINDKQDSQWVTWHGGSNDGTPFLVYLLMMSPEDYDHYKTGPQRKRQADIQASMRMGKGSEGESNTYAPNLPDGSGEQGFNQIRSGGDNQ